MTRFWAALSRALDVDRAAEALANEVSRGLEGNSSVVGGMLLATAAAGKGAIEVGHRLGQYWPDITLLGTSFEGILADGRTYRHEPAYLLLAWSQGVAEPTPLVFEPGEQDATQIARVIAEAAGDRALTEDDLVLLFPDALGSSPLERVLANLGPQLGRASLAGAAASGLDGFPAQAFFGDDLLAGSFLGLFVPGSSAGSGPRVQSAGGSLAASPWLEITACRPRWVDGLDGERALDWVSRQLGLESGAPLEPYLDRLLARVRPRRWVAREDRDADFEERYVIGIDERRGAFSLPGRVSCGDHLALALPDAAQARTALRTSIDALVDSPFLLQFTCRARDAALHGDSEVESAWVAHHAPGRRVLGVTAPFQLSMNGGDSCRLLVHATVLAALGQP